MKVRVLVKLFCFPAAVLLFSGAAAGRPAKPSVPEISNVRVRLLDADPAKGYKHRHLWILFNARFPYPPHWGERLIFRGHCSVDGRVIRDEQPAELARNVTAGETKSNLSGWLFGDASALDESPRNCELKIMFGEWLEPGQKQVATFCWDGSSVKAGACPLIPRGKK